MSKIIGLGEAAKHFGMSVLELIARMKYDGINSEAEGNQFSFANEVCIDKKRLLKLVDIVVERGKGMSKQEWEELRESSSYVFNEIYMPSAAEIENIFGSWDAFLRGSKENTVEKKYEVMRQAFIRADIEYSPRIKRGSPVHDLVLREVAKSGLVSKATADQWITENGFLDGAFFTENIDSLEKLASTKLCEKFYAGEEKAAIRELICDSISTELELVENLSYLGMPSANFLCYQALQKNLGHNNKRAIHPTRSLAVEVDRTIANIMESIIRHHEIIKGGEIFKDLRVYNGSIEEALARSEFENKKFQLVFLDFEGGWSPKKEEAIANLFKHNHLDSPSLVYITLNNSPLEEKRVMDGRGRVTGYGTYDQNDLVSKCIFKNAEDFEVKQIIDPTTSQYQDTVSMVSVGYKFVRKNHGHKL
jgi:hypothetical protein